MTSPRRREPARRAEPGRRSAARPTARSSARPTARPGGRRTTRTAPSLPPPRAAALTTRAAVLGLVLCGLLVSAALPLREFFSQREQISELREQQAEQRARVAALEQRKAQLQDPVAIAAEARQRLHFVRPGETAYVVIPPGAPQPDTFLPATPGLRRSGSAAAPWYSRVYSSVRDADRPPPPPGPATPEGG